MKHLARLFASILLILVPAVTRAEWHEASSTHFLVFAEGSAESVREFATRLERFDKGMRVINGLPDEDLGPANRVVVYVVRDIGAVRRLWRGRDDVAGFYVPRAGGSIAFTPRRAGNGSEFDLNAETILFHEYSHHFMKANYVGACPAWFAEGFAEFNATARVDKDGGVGFGIPAYHRAYELLGTNLPPIAELVGVSEHKASSQQAQAALYSQGWALTHFMNFEPARTGQLSSYLAALNRGTPALEAARAAFGDLKALDRELGAYLKRRRLPYIRIAPEKLPIGAVKVRQLRPGEAAILPLRMRSRRGVARKEAKALIPAMRLAAAPFPGDAAVQATLAEAEYDAGNYSEAEAAADRALAVEPANIDALTYKGRVAMARAKADANGGAASWTEARRRLIAANRVDPNDPEPIILFYVSFHTQGIAPTRNAVAGLLRAFELAPQDRSLRTLVARQYLIDRKGPEARATIAPLAFDPHGGSTGQKMQAILAKLDESGPEAALATWESMSAREAEAEEPDEGEEPKKPKPD